MFSWYIPSADLVGTVGLSWSFLVLTWYDATRGNVRRKREPMLGATALPITAASSHHVPMPVPDTL
eukprot:3789578-Rhodomonas_salina.2